MPLESPNNDLNANSLQWNRLTLTVSGIAICAVVISLFLNAQAFYLYDNSVDIDQQMSDLQEHYYNLGECVVEINEPGNDVFLSKDIPRERKRLAIANQNYQDAKELCVFSLNQNMAPLDAQPFVNEMKSLNSEVERINVEANRIFGYLEEQNHREASERMAVMDHSFATSIHHISDLYHQLHKLRQSKSNKGYSAAHAYFDLEYITAGIAVLLVIITTWCCCQFTNVRQLRNQKYQDQASKTNAIFDNALYGIISIDESGIIQSVNPACEKMFGYSANELIGTNIKIIVPEKHRDHHDDYIQGYLNNISSHIIGVTRELRGQRKDGSIVEVELSVSEIWIDNQRIFSGMIHDLTEKKEANRQLAQLYSMVESSDDAIVTQTLDGMISYWNKGAEHLFGYKREEVLGKPISILTPDHLKDEDANLLDWVNQGHRTEHYDSVRIDKNGTPIDVSLNISPIKNEEDEVVGISVIARDVSDRYLAMQEVLASQERAEKANQVKSEFLANMSHEIRTPMTAILGYSDILLDKTEEPESKQAVQTIQRNGHYLLDIINDILDLSKIESGKLELEKRDHSPVSLITDVISLMQVRADSKKIKLHSEFIGEMPNTIKTDPTRLRQILVNLVGNAIKFTETGSVCITSKIFELSGDHQLQIDIIDTGIGMSEEALSKVFTPFAQADSSTTRKFGGTGLGLSITKRLVKMLDGSISVFSEVGKGSTFRICFELGTLAGIEFSESTSEISKTTQNQPPIQHEPTKITSNILLAEDGPDNQRLISFVLKKAGASVTIVENGQQALEQALEAWKTEKPFDVILMDMQMPVLDGYAATQKLRDAGYQLPIIALTAHAMESDRKKCINAGCDDYTTKPIDRAKLISLIAKYTPATSVQQ